MAREVATCILGQRPADHLPDEIKAIYIAQTTRLLTLVDKWAAKNHDNVSALIAEIDDVDFSKS